MNQDGANPYEPPQTPGGLNGDENESLANPGRPEKTTEKLVVLATFSSAVDAHQLRNELENSGIVAQVANEASTSAFGVSVFGPISAFWIEVLVKESDAERALPIKQRFGVNDDTEEIPEWTCGCGETVDAGFSACWSCETLYEPPSA